MSHERLSDTYMSHKPEKEGDMKVGKFLKSLWYRYEHPDFCPKCFVKMKPQFWSNRTQGWKCKCGFERG